MLDDGLRVRLRLGTPEDRDILIVGFDQLSAGSRQTRFFTSMPRLSSQMLDWLVDVDSSDRVAIAAFDIDRPAEIGSRTDGYGIGVARYYRDTADPTRAEVAVAVIDEYQGRGLGTLLLETLARHAIDNGVSTFVATVLADNDAMRRMLTDLGATFESDPDDTSVLGVVLPLDRLQR